MTSAPPDSCPACGARGPAARRARPRLLGYLLFAGSFLAYFWYTSVRKISPPLNFAWIAAQISLCGWAIVERRRGPRLVFYCRSCSARLPL